MVETTIVERGGKITLPEKFLKTLRIKHKEKVVIEFNTEGLLIKPIREICSITKQIAKMSLPVADWEEMEREIEAGRDR